MVCPIQNIKRTLYVKSQTALGVPATIGPNDAIRTISADFSISEEGEIDRSDVWSGYGNGVKNITGSLGWEISLQTELMGPSDVIADWRLLPLFRGCPIADQTTATGTLITPAEGGCLGVDVIPFTLEIHEEGGAIWRVTDCTATFTMAADPASRVLVDWTVTGDYNDPVDNADLVQPNYGADPLPLIYRDAQLTFTYVDEDGGVPIVVDLPNCPAFAFDPAVETSEIPSACTQGGRALRFNENSNQPTLTLSGVIREKPSLQPLFYIATKDKTVNISLKVAEYDVTGVAREFVIELPNATLNVPELTDLDKYLGTDLTFVGFSKNPQPSYRLAFEEE